MPDFFGGPGLSWTSLLRDIKILYTHVAIEKMTATERKDNTNKYLIFLHPLGFTVSNINPLSVNPTKWSNTLKQIVGKLPRNCLSVFDHFVGLALKGLKELKRM